MSDRAVFVLGSSSASRLMVLRSAGIEPLVVIPEVDEDAIRASFAQGTDELEIMKALSAAKCEAVREREGDRLPSRGVLVTADSMLLIDGELQGKPGTVEEAVSRWRSQSGKTGTLLTSHHLVDLADSSTPPVHFVVGTKIHFGHPTDADIETYCGTGEPLYCAGAFTLEGRGGWFIDAIDGDPTSVLGISLPGIRRALYELGYTVSDFGFGS